MFRDRSIIRRMLLIGAGLLLMSEVGHGQFGGRQISERPIRPIPPGSVKSHRHTFLPVPSEQKKILLAKLNTAIELDFNDTPLSEVIKFLAESSTTNLGTVSPHFSGKSS